MNSSVKKTAVKLLRFLPPLVIDGAINRYLYYKKRNLRKLQTPTSVIFYVTNKCNLKCGHCFYWDSLNKKTNELNLSEISKIADSLTHPISLSLTGGEPFLRKDFVDIVEIFVIKKKVKEIAIASNGFYVDKTFAFCERFLSCNKHIPLSIQISLDGMEETHDSIRMVKGSFKHALDTLDELLNLSRRYKSFSVSAGIAVQKRNFLEMEELTDLLGEKGVTIRINLIRGESSGTYGVMSDDSSHVDPREGSDITLSIEEMNSLYKVLCQRNEIYDFWSKRHQRIFEIGMQVIEKKKRVTDCYAGTIDAVIYSNGDVAFCELTKPVGNLLDYDYNIQKLWNNRDSISMRQKVKKCFCTHGCNISTSLMFEPDIVRESIFSR